MRRLVNKINQVFDARGDLRTPKVDRRGGEILPAFPELLIRPPRRGEDVSQAADFEWRRADGMQAACAVWMTVAACCDWLTMEVRDPKGGLLSVERLAELAEMTIDRTERGLRVLRTAGVISFTKQHREKKPDGSCKATGPALRRLSPGSFHKLGVMLGRYFDGRRAKLGRAKERTDREAYRRGSGADPRSRQMIRNLVSAPEHRTHAGAPPPPRPGQVPEDMKAAIAKEHPEWTFAEILQEGRRRLGLDTS